MTPNATVDSSVLKLFDLTLMLAPQTDRTDRFILVVSASVELKLLKVKRVQSDNSVPQLTVIHI